MSNKRPPKRQRQRRQQAGQATPSEAAPDEQDLIQHIDEALDEDHPLALLELVSAIVSATDPRSRDPFQRDDTDAPSLDEFVESMLGVDIPHTTAVLAVVGAMSENELQAARIRREITRRSDALPAWLGHLGHPDVHRAVEMVHVLGGGDNVLLGARLRSGHELTAVIYVDHDLGTVVKDAFVVPQPIESMVEEIRAAAADPDMSWNDLDLANARVRLADAIERGAMTYPPYETDTWPACRPLVEWLVRRLPTGGRGYERPEWSDEALRQLADDFFASPFGAKLDDADHRSLLDSMLWYGTDYGNGDPLRWSTVSVEILLADWLPRKLAAEADYLLLAPELLRAFVRYAHDRCGIRADLTDEAIAMIDELEPEYQETVAQLWRPPASLAVLDATGVLGPEAEADEDESVAELVVEALHRAVGGEAALRTLSTEPLPDEEFEWHGIPDDVRERVDEIRRLCDGCCDRYFDHEYRTACRRLLARAAAGDPSVFRRKGKPTTAAGAICWIVAKANDAIGYWKLEAQEMLSHFGIKSGGVSQRAGVMLRAAGLEWQQYGGMELGTPDYLVSSRRERIVKLRDIYIGQPA